VQEALKKVDAGDVAPLVKLADGGDTDAQYLAGMVFLFGRGTIPKAPARGCAYEEKASARRADAMHLVGMCYQSGASGAPDKAKAEAAYARAADMGFTKSKCALGQMLMADPKRTARGLALCQEAGEAGDVEAQVAVGNAYFNGSAGKRDLAAARTWYDKAAQQKNFDASRKLGQMYANGDGGPKDVKKALELWTAAEKAGDPLVAILVADQLFSDITGGRKPGPGRYGFRGGIPVKDIEIVEAWYQQAKSQDPRPDVQKRADYALSILARFKTAATSSH
jgi:TPR repeat protein